MIPTYDKAKEQKDLLDFDTAQTIYTKLLSENNHNDSELKEYWDDFITECMNYSNFRSLWLTLSREEKNENDFDAKRTSVHNELIRSLKVIKRYLELEDKDTSWYEEITDNRKRIGDFANYIAYVYALNAR
ncbi:hypothetical protein BHU61_00395 [Macrococcus epidermidis]|uniref:Uncharacterized protein n=1 Tax=Macrococcus epidermidis TaxID=1902580 RepID=A0A327ZY34_9STAP|nr:DUF3232 domain-containing protein [Macrococcus epidermidis]RAK45938.1 hypothetical protein BHU61_00395 [Macrococcus epidermidis]